MVSDERTPSTAACSPVREKGFGKRASFGQYDKAVRPSWDFVLGQCAAIERDYTHHTKVKVIKHQGEHGNDYDDSSCSDYESCIDNTEFRTLDYSCYAE
eukprot:TRINITY_DN148422_c0_g2_i1.p1 TRINITY_DN148422_c0_g2~~TRINITY_DN148422_c0_g2_i1.p1  ORF type:complete len:114 (-),score=15.30 TRINITY_DN148422_c0_g2_i1:197-493(-)